ncbi:MAG: hypothetical protein GY943_16060 [Chloroflexi bacterium]|nr:hypothetical protein [Chloroflexota bacterium]
MGEGKLYGAQENNIFYYLGCAYEGLEQNESAQACFAHDETGLSEPSSAIFYNDQPPDMIYYQGLARQKLGQKDEAEAIFQKLIAYGQAHMVDKVNMDYFAISLPHFLVFDEDLKRRNQIHCHYMSALGYMGSDNVETAVTHFAQILKIDASHLGAFMHQPQRSTHP